MIPKSHHTAYMTLVTKGLTINGVYLIVDPCFYGKFVEYAENGQILNQRIDKYYGKSVLLEDKDFFYCHPDRRDDLESVIRRN